MSGVTRAQVRELLNRLFSLGVSPLGLAYHLEKRLLKPDIGYRLINSYGGLVGLLPGFSGDFVRRAFYRQVLRHMHESATISQGAMFSSDDIEIDEGVYIGGGSVVGRSRIGKHAMLGDYVVVIPGRHTHRFTAEGTLVVDEPGEETPICIGEHAWIGSHAVVMADVGARSTVGAGAVVVQPIPEDVVAAGNPARVVRRRQP